MRNGVRIKTEKVKNFGTLAATSMSYLCVQVRRHGTQDDCRQDRGRSLLSQWGAGDRLAGPCNRIQLQSHLPPEPARRQEEGAEGV